MLIYPNQAITVKTIDKFTYNMYLDIYINMLKYNNDSSTILRILSSCIDTSQDVLEDLAYKPRFNLKHLDFVTIDRFSGFYLDKIPDIKITNYDGDSIIGDIFGYSKYTGRSYILEEVQNNSDWVRHSLPCDGFLGDYTEVGGQQMITMFPNMNTVINIPIIDSAITIRPYSGLTSMNLIDSNVTLTVTGIDITGKERKEDIVINSYTDYKTVNQYSFITSIRSVGLVSAFTIVLYPYINGEYESWDNDIIDRETFEIYPTFMTVDIANKNLVFNIVSNNGSQFPVPNEAYKLVRLDLEEDDIYTYFIDAPNKLLYIVSSMSQLYCFPLIIPKKSNNTLDKIKTKYQSMNIEYYDDSIAREYTFYIFPTSSTNDVETMSIFVNGAEYASDLLLDIYRENIETNRIVIPYSVLFNNSDDALIEFKTYGLDESISPIYVHDKKLKPLYSLDLTSINIFSPYMDTKLLKPYTSTRNLEYQQVIFGDIGASGFSILKLSSKANVLINGYEIVNVFNTFNYDESTNTVITSDTISGLSSELVQGSLSTSRSRSSYGEVIYGTQEV